MATQDESKSARNFHSPARILIVDDHPIVREGFAQLIGNHADLEVCGSAANEQEAMEMLAATHPALAIVDITLEDSHGLDLIDKIHLRRPHVKILVVSAHDELLYAERVLEAGALGYINKRETSTHLIDAIRTVLAGEVFVSQRVSGRMLRRRVPGSRGQQQSPAIESLTDRELQVYEMTGQGRNTHEIANKLHLSPKTVERYKENIKHKLGLNNATQLVRQATRWVLEKG